MVRPVALDAVERLELPADLITALEEHGDAGELWSVSALGQAGHLGVDRKRQKVGDAGQAHSGDGDAGD